MKINIQKKISAKWLEEIKKINKNLGSNSLNTDVILESSHISRTFLGPTNAIKKELQEGKGFIEISGLPVNVELPPPPKNGNKPKGKSYISDLFLLGITHAIGLNPFSYQEEKDGCLVHEIAPSPKSSNSRSSLGTVEFDFHCDGAYLSRDIRPHTLSLMCLVNKARQGTYLSSIDESLKKIDKETIHTLLEKDFKHIAPETFKVDTPEIISSVLDKIDGHYEIKAAFHNTVGLTEKAQAALKALKNAVKSTSITKNWEPGDLVIFNNTRCMHGRGPIQGERWLQRCYGSKVFKTGTIVNLSDIQV